MYEHIKIENVIQTCDSPFIITLNNKFQLIGDEARAMGQYCQKGMKARVQYHMSNADFIVEKIRFPELFKGVQISTYI